MQYLHSNPRRLKPSFLFMAGFAFLFIIQQNTTFVNAQTATAPSTGDGSAGSPYEIATLDNLYWLSQTSSAWGDHFVQTTDIDASSTSSWNGGNGFLPIGNSNTSFTGSYDGSGYTITGLTINRTSTNNAVGFLGTVEGATLTNIKLSEVNIRGHNSTGGLIGEAYSGSVITKNSITGIVDGRDNVGGIVGKYEPGTAFIATSDFSENYSNVVVEGSTYAGGIVGSNSGAISNCYSLGNVDVPNPNNQFGGGIAGYSDGSIINCYASGSITGNLTAGLVGENDGIVTNSYWNIESTGQSTGIHTDTNSQTTTGLSTIEMKKESEFVGWDFSSVWIIFEGSSYPYLRNNIPEVIPPNADFAFAKPSGQGTTSSPFLISTLEELGWLSITESVWDSTFLQTADIDASAAISWDAGAGFSPIGNNTYNFSGNYNGDGFSISGLVINRSTNDNIGLFGIATNGVLDQIKLTNVSIEGNDNVGAIIGYMDGDSLSNSSVSGSISGNNNIGGLVGYVNSGTLELNNATATISSEVLYIGGLVGWNKGNITKSFSNVTIQSNFGFAIGGITGRLNSNGSISDSYATGSIEGYEGVGGIIGFNYGDLTNSYFSGTISSVEDYGGVAGGYLGGTLSGIYWDTDRSGTTSAFGFGSGQTATGYTSSEMREESNFPEFDFINTWDIQEIVSSPFLQEQIPDTLPNLYSLASFPQGDGTLASPFLISNLNELYWLSQNETVWDSNFVQIADIDASSTSAWDEGEGFSPIGNNNPSSFTGSYNGGNYSITGLTISRDSTNHIGFFGSVADATLSNINLLDIDINSAESRFVGALAGAVNGMVTITGNTSTGNVRGKEHVGGLIGSLSTSQLSDPLSNNSSSTTVVATDEAVGGLIGTFSNGQIQNSYATGNVSGLSLVGGLIGAAHDTVTTSYATGTVTGSGQTVGGLIGQNTVFISKSYAMGNVKGSDLVGGLIGENVGKLDRVYATGDVNGTGSLIGGLNGVNASSNLTNCFSTGVVNGSINVGGLIGAYYGGTLSNCFATGNVNGTSSTGGFIGINTGTVTESYWNIQTTGVSTGIGSNAGTGSPASLTIGQMSDSTNFFGWDFASDTVWTIDNGFTFPYLKDLGDHRMVVATIDSGEGWRMIGNPSNVTYGELLEPIWTQGFTGADTESGSPNVYFYEEGTQNWASPTNSENYFGSNSSDSANTNLNGVLLYVYADDDADGTDDAWPKYLVSENSYLNESFDV